MADRTISSPAGGPLVLRLGPVVGTLQLHDYEGDGSSFVPQIRTAAGAVVDLLPGASVVETADGTIPGNRLVKGHTDGTLIVGTLGSKRILGVNLESDQKVLGMPLQLGAGFVDVVAAEPITAGDLIKCGDNGRVLQLADADNVNTVIGTGTAGNFQNQPANDGLKLVSDDADDDADVTIIGTTHGGHTVVTETIALTGTDAVATKKTDWGLILAVKKGVTEGTVTIREASDNATVITLAAADLSKGVVAVAADSQGAHGLIPYIKAAAASTKEVGVLYEPATGAADAYGAAALNGTTAAPLPAAANLVKEIYLGDVATSTVATVYTNATEDDEHLAVGKALETIAAGATGRVYIRP
jgi:hypothetical protein